MKAVAVSAAILVGGRARRLGGQLKPSLRVGDETILDRQLRALRAAGVHEVLLVGRWVAPRVAGVHHVPDVFDGAGALGGLYTALLVATTPVVIVLAGDLPFVVPALIRRLGEWAPGYDAVVPRTGSRRHPLCAAYRRAVALGIQSRLHHGALRVTEALAGMRVREVGVDELAAIGAAEIVLMNVNTPDDYRRAERCARSGS